MPIEIVEVARLPIALEVERRGVGVKMHCEQASPDQIRLDGFTDADGEIGLAHAQIEVIVRQNHVHVDVGIKLQKLAQPGREPVGADAHGGRDAQFAMRTHAAVRQAHTRRLELLGHVSHRAKQGLALFRQDQAAGMAMEQRRLQVLFKGADLPADGRLAQTERVARVGERTGVRHRVKNPQLVPVHSPLLVGPVLERPVSDPPNYPCAARWLSAAARNFSASSAAMQPMPAAVTACR